MKIANPNYIFCASGLKEQILVSPDYSELKAVQEENVYEMDPAYMVRQGRTVLQAVTFIHGIVYENLETNASNAPASSKRPLNVINSESNVSGKITKNKTPPRILNNAGIQRAKNT